MKTLGASLVAVGVMLFVAGWIVLYRLPGVDGWGVVAGLLVVVLGGWLRWRWRGALAAPVLTVFGAVFLLVAINLGVRGFGFEDEGRSSAAVTPSPR